MRPSGATHPIRLWRIFPWDPTADPGEAFSNRSWAPRERQGAGRFDLPAQSAVLYLAETAAHGYAEVLQPYRTQILMRKFLRTRFFPLAHQAIHVSAQLDARIADLTDPAVLAEHGIRPDVLALPSWRGRAQTQTVALRLWNAGFAGLRWWSAFHGAWHTTALFMERAAEDDLIFRRPRPATVKDPDVIEGARAAGLRIRGDRA